MVNRREVLGIALGAGFFGVHARPLRAAVSGELIQRTIPASGEQLPVIGLGSSATFGEVAHREDVSGLKEVMKAMLDHGARVLDTAPSYGDSERVAGKIARELGATNKFFWATKVNVAYGGRADPVAARVQIEESFQKLGVKRMDLIQIHNLGDVPAQIAILKELKNHDRVRYIGATTAFEYQYDELLDVMRREPLDFIGVDYAVDNREVEQEILPLALERKIGVLGYAPFGRSSLFQRVGDRPVPGWASDFDASTWAQFFIKYVIGHPAITAVTPATSQAKHMLDNLAGGVGRLPNEAARKRMANFIDDL